MSIKSALTKDYPVLTKIIRVMFVINVVSIVAVTALALYVHG